MPFLVLTFTLLAGLPAVFSTAASWRQAAAEIVNSHQTQASNLAVYEDFYAASRRTLAASEPELHTNRL